MPSYLTKKTAVAALPENCAPRASLMEKFHKAADRRFFYVSGQAGSGKTVSAALWLAACERRPLWIGLDEYDNTLFIFYRQFASVILSTQPKNENMNRVFSSPSFSSAPIEHIVAALAELAPDEKLYALVLDDFHVITSPEILKSLPAVLGRLPGTFTVSLLSREAPPEEYRSFLGTDASSVITEADLRFSANELTQYMNGMGNFPSAEEIDFVRLFTGGLAIRVAAVAKSGNLRFDRTGGGFEEYLKRRLWPEWDEELREFMLKASVADEVTEPLAVLLCGDGAPQIIARLSRENAFFSGANGVYRYHSLFLRFLRRLAEDCGVNLTEPYKITAEYYLAIGEYLTARRYAIRSGDENTILKMIHLFQQYTNPSLDEYVAFSKVFNRESMTEEICERRPYLYMARLYEAFLSGEAESAERFWDKLRAHTAAIAKEFPQMLETAILMLSLDYRRPFAKLIEGFSALPPIASKSEGQQGASVTMQMPFLHRSIRDYYELADERVMENLADSFGLLLKEHYAVTRQCLLSGLALEQNRLPEARQAALRAKEEAANIKSPEFIFAAHMHLAAVYHATGEQTQRDGVLDETQRFIEISGASYLNRNFLAYKTKLALCDGDKNAAREWLDCYFVDERYTDERIPLYKIFQYFTTARAYIVLNQPDKAADIARGLIRLAGDFRRPQDLAEAKTLLACLRWATGDKRGGADLLAETLRDTAKYGFIRVVADEGASVAPVLKRIAARTGKEGADAGRVMKAALAASDAAKRCKGICCCIENNGKPVKLSKQQKKMIEFLARGLKNAQISELTGLAAPTVKGHISLAYEKLGAHNAVDAVLRARELGLID